MKKFKVLPIHGFDQISFHLPICLSEAESESRAASGVVTSGLGMLAGSWLPGPGQEDGGRLETAAQLQRDPRTRHTTTARTSQKNICEYEKIFVNAQKL